MDSWKSVLQQAKDNLRQLSNLSVNAAKIFEQNSKQTKIPTLQLLTLKNNKNNISLNNKKSHYQ
jgi:hypothetical protein